MQGAKRIDSEEAAAAAASKLQSRWGNENATSQEGKISNLSTASQKQFIFDRGHPPQITLVSTTWM
eukprot:scaffold221_cov113-Skeletonema_dohrnii-CCMP3373.AAC.6